MVVTVPVAGLVDVRPGLGGLRLAGVVEADEAALAVAVRRDADRGGHERDGGGAAHEQTADGGGVWTHDGSSQNVDVDSTTQRRRGHTGMVALRTPPDEPPFG